MSPQALKWRALFFVVVTTFVAFISGAGWDAYVMPVKAGVLLNLSFFLYTTIKNVLALYDISMRNRLL